MRERGTAQLDYKIDSIMKDRRMRQVDAASLLGIRRPDVSKMLRAEFRQFSAETLVRFLATPRRDVVRPHRDKNDAPVLRVA